MKLRILLLGMCMLGCVVCAQAGVVYNAATDFSATANPNGVWSYGHYTGLDPATFEVFPTAELLVGTTTVDTWHIAPDWDPNVLYNSGDTEVSIYDITLEPGAISMGPSNGPTVVRWTAPAAGNYDVSAAFLTIQGGVATTANVAVYSAGEEQFMDMAGPLGGDPIAWSDTLSVEAGGYIDFVAYGVWGAANTQLVDSTITEALEVPKIPGDANDDKKVDGSDVTILAGNWQAGVGGVGGATWEMGDFNGDGAVDGSDVTILAGNWQYGVTAAAAAVPEPSTIILLLSALAALATIRRMKK